LRAGQSVADPDVWLDGWSVCAFSAQLNLTAG
jgi:hypothetical protein